MKNSFITRYIKAGDQSIPGISTKPGLSDIMGSVMVRCGINRSKYRVDPGLYAVGSPGPGSDLFVTANYKLTFDTLRKNLSGMDGWILVLDTKGVNVWCAAGKGTFGTKELVDKIKMFSLDKVVDHRRLIVPQLGATGIAAHIVKEQSGFNVRYGPVRASDIRRFIENKYRADREMRKVKFGITDRIKLIPNDFLYGKFFLLGAIVLLLALTGLHRGGLSYKDLPVQAGPVIGKILLGYCGGLVLTPLLLPWLPGRHFSLKGLMSGIIGFLVYMLFIAANDNLVERISWFFIISAISSFLAMNFTGSSTYTSLSGVKKEMKVFIPVQIAFALVGLVLQVTGKFI